MSAEELFDVVDEHDVVIGQEVRSEVHRLGLRHRAVQIFVFRSDGSLLLAQRSETKDECPLLWSSSAAGHVDAGEAPHQAAVRELMEELSLFGDLEELQTFPATEQNGWEFTTLFRLRSDQLPIPDEEEVAAWECRPLTEIEEDLRANPQRYTPAFHAVFGWYMDRLRGLPAE